jgi:hypothetical protein
MDLEWEMDLIAEFVFWMGLLAQCWIFQDQRWKEVVRGFRHQSNYFLERVVARAAGLPLRMAVNCHDSSRRHFVGVI